MKKLFSILSVIVLGLFNIISPATYALDGDGSSSCFIVEDGSITDYLCSETNLTIPSSIDGVDIIGIGAQAFRGKGLTSLTIEEGIKYIGKWAFAENQLTSITLPTSLESIEEAAFNKNLLEGNDAFIYTIGSKRLVSYAGTETSITIPADVTSIGASAFRDMGITNVIIPNGVTNIGYMAFAGNELVNLSLPSNILTIGSYAFERNNLTSLPLLPSSIQEIDKEAFCDQKSSNNVVTKIARDFGTEFDNTCLDVDRIYNLTFKDGNTVLSNGLLNDGEMIEFPMGDYDGKGWFDGDNQYSEGDVMPEKDLVLTTKVLSGCFIINDSIIVKYICDDTDIVIPNKVDGEIVVGIGTGVFEDRGITSLTFKTTSLENIYQNAFAYNKLTEIDIPNTVKYIGDSAFRSLDDNTSVKITSLILGNSVKIVGAHAFAYNRITNLSIPNAVERIEKGAFRDNKNIKNLIIPSNVKYIGEAAFRNNDEMTNLTIENGVEEIGTGAFYNDQIKNVVIPNSVKYIRDSAFRNNTYPNFTISIGNGLEELGQWAFCKGSAISGGDIPICETKNISIDSISLANLGGAGQIAVDHVDRNGPYLNVDSYTYYTVLFKDAETEILSGKYLSGETIIYPADLRDNDKNFEGWEPNPTVMSSENLIINAKWSNKATSGSCFGTTELSNGTLEITSYDISCGTDVVIPSKINGKIVTHIGAGCFQTTAPGITSVVLPYSVTNIGNLAFRACGSLASVTITNPDTVIPEGSFWHSGVQIRFFVPSEITDETLNNSIKKGSSVISHVYTKGRLVYYKDGTTIVDAELYENNVTLGDTMMLSDKDGYQFLGWSGIPTDGKVTSNLNLMAIWKDDSSTITPDECFIYETKNKGGIPFTNIQGYIESCGDEVIIPSVLNGGTVDVLSNSPFRYKNIRKLVLPDTLVTIGGGGAAYNPNLIEIVFPNSLTSLGDGAFRNDGLTGTLVLPNSLTSIGMYSFYANTIDTVIIGNNLNSVGQYSFCGRSDGLSTRALLPKSISEYSSAFLNQLDEACLEYAQICTITFEDGSGNILSDAIYGYGDEIIIPDFDTDREGYEFLGWRGLPSDGKAKGDQTITPLWKEVGGDNPDECFIYDTDDYTLIDYVKGCGEDVVLPHKTLVLGTDALKGKGLKSVILNDGLQTILTGALGNNDLTELNLPMSMVDFNPNALLGNPNLEKVRNSEGTTPDICFTVHAANGKYQITAYNTNCGSDVIIPGMITSTVGGSVPTRIVRSIAGFGSSIKRVDISGNITRIAANTFYGANLEELVLHDGVTEIGMNAFGGNNNLERVFIGTGLLNAGSSIGGAAFCKNGLDTTKRVGIVSPDNYGLVTDEVRTKFSDVCVDLQLGYTVRFVDDNGDPIIEEVYGSGEIIKLPEVLDNGRGSVIAWMGLPNNNVVSSDLIITAIRRSVGEDTPEECFTIEDGIIIDYINTCGTDVVIPSFVGGESVKSIGNNVFQNMGLTSLKISDGIKEIGESAFENNNIKTLIMPDSVSKIGNNAFRSNSLGTLKLSKNINSIGDSAFAENELTAVRIPLSIEEVGNSAFCSATNSPVEGLISEDFPEDKYGSFKNSCIELVKGLYLIIFDTAGGSSIPSIEGEYKDPINVIISDPTWKGHRFLGWDKNLPSKMPADDMIITAYWEELPVGYSGRGKRVNVENGDVSTGKDLDRESGIGFGKNENRSGNRTMGLDDLKNKTLTRGNLALITNMIVSMFPELIDNRPIINTNCTDYSDYIDFTDKEKKSIEKLCKVGIMGIHNTTQKPLNTFMVNKIVPMNQFQLVMERTFVDYKDSILVDIMKHVQGRKDIDFFTVYEIIMLVKNKLK